jgi:hypothetical protein
VCVQYLHQRGRAGIQLFIITGGAGVGEGG